MLARLTNLIKNNFPLPLQKNGKYPWLKTDGGRTVCPLCARTEFLVYGHTHVECATCRAEFSFHGVDGLELININHVPVKIL